MDDTRGAGAEWRGGNGRMGGGGAVASNEGSEEADSGAGLADGCGDAGQDAKWLGRTLWRRVI